MDATICKLHFDVSFKWAIIKSTLINSSLFEQIPPKPLKTWKLPVLRSGVQTYSLPSDLVHLEAQGHPLDLDPPEELNHIQLILVFKMPQFVVSCFEELKLKRWDRWWPFLLRCPILQRAPWNLADPEGEKAQHLVFVSDPVLWASLKGSSLMAAHLRGSEEADEHSEHQTWMRRRGRGILYLLAKLPDLASHPRLTLQQSS